ncbi:MAG: hypothetical protein IPK60_20630 [Sandaracinaceae bacterium]|nr:hypothetical protein [Sandaracinaceae bacterium]
MCYKSILAAVDAAGAGGGHKGRRTAVLTSLGLIEHAESSQSGRTLNWLALEPIDLVNDKAFVTYYLNRIHGVRRLSLASS